MDELADVINEDDGSPTDTLRKALVHAEGDERWQDIIVIANDSSGFMRLMSSNIAGGKTQEMGMLRGALLIIEKDWLDGPIEEVESL